MTTFGAPDTHEDTVDTRACTHVTVVTHIDTASARWEPARSITGRDDGLPSDD